MTLARRVPVHHADRNQECDDEDHGPAERLDVEDYPEERYAEKLAAYE